MAGHSYSSSDHAYESPFTSSFFDLNEYHSGTWNDMGIEHYGNYFGHQLEPEVNQPPQTESRSKVFPTENGHLVTVTVVNGKTIVQVENQTNPVLDEMQKKMERMEMNMERMGNMMERMGNNMERMQMKMERMERKTEKDEIDKKRWIRSVDVYRGRLKEAEATIAQLKWAQNSRENNMEEERSFSDENEIIRAVQPLSPRMTNVVQYTDSDRHWLTEVTVPDADVYGWAIVHIDKGLAVDHGTTPEKNQVFPVDKEHCLDLKEPWSPLSDGDEVRESGEEDGARGRTPKYDKKGTSSVSKGPMLNKSSQTLPQELSWVVTGYDVEGNSLVNLAPRDPNSPALYTRPILPVKEIEEPQYKASPEEIRRGYLSSANELWLQNKRLELAKSNRSKREDDQFYVEEHLWSESFKPVPESDQGQKYKDYSKIIRITVPHPVSDDTGPDEV